MCGKPLIIVKSPGANAPSDLKRTDWIDYDPLDTDLFSRSFGQALDELETFQKFESDLLHIALEARLPDCGIALERCNKGFLLSGDGDFIESAERLLEKLDGIPMDLPIYDVERLRTDIKTFIRQARGSLADNVMIAPG